MATQRNRAFLEALWISGYTPTEANFDDVWASFLNLSNDTSDSITPGVTNLFFTDARVTASPAVVANTAKVTNATHTGDVTGATVLTIAAGVVTETKIGTGAVTEDKLGAGSVVEAKIGTGAVTAGKIGTNAVTEQKIIAGAVSNTKLSNVATATIKGRTTSGAGTPEDLTVAQAQAMLGISLYSDFWIDTGYMIDAITAGATSANEETGVTVKTLRFASFDPSVEDYQDFTFTMPLDYDGGTVKAKFHWDAAPTASGTAIWGIRGVALGDSDAYTTAFGTEQTVTDTVITVGDNHISDATPAITIGNTPASGDLIVWRVTLKSASTIAVDGKLKGIQIQYTKLTSQVAAW